MRECTCKRSQPQKRRAHQFGQNHADNVLTGASQNIVKSLKNVTKEVITDCW